MYTVAEFAKRARTENAFVTRVLEQPRLWVIGSEHDLPSRLSASPVRETSSRKNLRTRLKDAENEANSLESRFDLAYGAAHALCLAALRHHGFRASKRYIVFQVLPDTLALGLEGPAR